MNQSGHQLQTCAAVLEKHRDKGLILCEVPAVTTIRVRTRTADVVVPVCALHKKQHSEAAARARSIPTVNH